DDAATAESILARKRGIEKITGLQWHLIIPHHAKSAILNQGKARAFKGNLTAPKELCRNKIQF
ncbi:MAG TPA: hypothetical protein PLR25_23890, partial [Planctomycetaceae bacterium]|nr:hypothetical protein [Planctomycetaceae bacterium]